MKRSKHSRDRAEKDIKDAFHRAAKAAHRRKRKASAMADHAAADVQAAADRLRARAMKAGGVPREAAAAADSFVRRNPLLIAAGGLVAGAVLSSLFRRRNG
ncbi:hypothetical protein [Falsirhodobacter deserti]|uniref:hypothetical protein n=1 Tax=Falsirhodobacter deserti TaxID=1365611 RepID=UPI000FE34511|nr:hypothetical protein [Falsirhodobacter deserti]